MILGHYCAFGAGISIEKPTVAAPAGLAWFVEKGLFGTLGEHSEYRSHGCMTARIRRVKAIDLSIYRD